MVEPAQKFEDRLQIMLSACCLTRPQLARLIHPEHGQQLIQGWIKRGRIGQKSAGKVRDVTRVSMDWLNDGIGDPFPNGYTCWARDPNDPDPREVEQSIQAYHAGEWRDHLSKHHPDIDRFVPSQAARFDDGTIAQAIDLLYLLADLRPDDKRFSRLTWPMIQVAAKAITRADSQRETVRLLLGDLETV